MSRFFARGQATQRLLVLAGDAYDLLDLLPDQSVDLFITSPPYWGLRTYGLSHNWDIASEWKRSGNPIERRPPYAWYQAPRTTVDRSDDAPERFFLQAVQDGRVVEFTYYGGSDQLLITPVGNSMTAAAVTSHWLLITGR